MVCKVRYFLCAVNMLGLTYWLFAHSTLLNFLTTYVSSLHYVLPIPHRILRQVIHTQLLKFHASLRDAKSLDEMIQVHGA
jgi:hypothetical protein